MRENIVLFPFGGNAREAALTIESLSCFEERFHIVGYLDDNYQNLKSADYPVLGDSARWNTYRHNARLLAVPGSARTFMRRASLIERFNLNAETAATIIDESVRISRSAKIGINCLIMANCFISVSVTIGNHCVILANSVVEHDARLADHVVVGSGVSISSSIDIGRNCYIGSGAKIREGLQIGEFALIGMGAVVVRDVPPRAIVAGVPARVVGEVDV